MSRTVKQDIDLLFDIKKQVLARMNPDFTQGEEVSEAMHYVDLIFENQNKWLLSDKISSEKQARMDAYKADKTATIAPEGGEDRPTKKQVNYIIEHGGNPEGMGFQEAKTWIKEYIAEHPFKEKK